MDSPHHSPPTHLMQVTGAHGLTARLAVDPVVSAAGSLVVAASTVVHGPTSAPARVLYRRATAPAVARRD